jgi:hypothetical protein
MKIKKPACAGFLLFDQQFPYFFSVSATGAVTGAATGADAAAGAATGAAGAAGAAGATVSAVFWPQAVNARASRAATSAIRFILVSLDSKLRYTIIYPDSNASKSKAAMHPKSKAAHSSREY